MCVSNETAVHWVRAFKRFYHAHGLGHVLLFVSYCSFLLCGAALFFVVETRTSSRLRDVWQHRLAEQRNRFIATELLPDIFNNSRLLVFIHDDKSQYLISILRDKLAHYEHSLRVRPPTPRLHWTFANSLLFTCSTVTTIGYGFIYPITRTGRILAVFYSLLGIPFTIVVIKDLAYLLARLLNYPCIVLGYLWHMFRYCTLQPVHEHELLNKLSGRPGRDDFRLAAIDRFLDIPVTVAISALAGWLGLGCVIMSAQFPEMPTETAFYFVFNSLATIGTVADVDPGETNALLPFFVYIIVGLALVSLFINLLHTKFSRVYWMPDRLMITTNRLLGDQQQPHASFDDDELGAGLDANVPRLNHYVTLGVLQAEDRRPLLGVLRREKALIDAETQTGTPHGRLVFARGNSPEAMLLPVNKRSHDDVNALIVETYTGRPARLIPR